MCNFKLNNLRKKTYGIDRYQSDERIKKITNSNRDIRDAFLGTVKIC